ncbi:prohormone-2-like [Diaphorina citri]|uniref:Prohormone-2-like n=1 Tax=Diaphorina citri TaxID=121845 RepID=A0A3Q0IS93_DIACI|nr:prohormone-2-like [Diaphorina citri]
MTLLQGFCLVLIFATVYALPSTLLEDVKHAELNKPRMNKVKRAQEVIMFGNQQNRAGDGRNNYARADKRGDIEDTQSLDEISPYPVPLMPLMRDNDLDIEPPRALPFRQNAYLYNHIPDAYFNDYSRYLGQRRKRSSYPARNQLSRNSRVFRSARSPSRAKRDLEIDPEDLFALLALWESERKNNPKYPEYQQREFMNFPYDHRKLDPEDDENNEISDGEDLRESGWLDGPIKLPSHKFISQDFAYPEWTPALLHQAKQNKEGDKVKVLSDLLANTPAVREDNIPLIRRYVL